MSGVRTINDIKARCYIEDERGCWHWRCAIDRSGPKVWIPALGRSVTLGVAVMHLSGKPVPPGFKVWRTCSSSDCGRPSHFEIQKHEVIGQRIRASGVLKADAARTANIVKVARQRKSNKVTPLIAAQIRDDVGPVTALAAKYGLSKSQVWNIRAGKSWASKPVAAASVFSFAANLERQAA